ncbi:ABC transporter substrate-binding protein [Aquamicrobium sp. LC103]|uniref:ABC transporter substrate-binding protein n=1 Tax=Aquamicrobium sp. LC103 TaxID=1120658 RepID=UPI0014858A01|nr:ABC transporter substrate-binding protein [Aquamicrobium sp. LC103]
MAALPSFAQAQDKVRVAAAAINIAHAPIALAAANPEIFAAQGLELEVTDLRGASPNCIAALISEAVEICQVGTPTGTDAIAEGADLVAVAIVSGPNGEFVLSSKAVESLSVNADAPVEDRIRALSGLSIVTSAPGSAYYTMFDSMMQTVGLSISDIRYRTLAEVPAMIEGIRNAALDGALWTVGSLSPVVLEGKGVRWISFARGDVENFQGLPFITAFARKDWVEQHPDVARRIHAAYADANARLRDRPEESAELIRAKYFPDLEAELWKDGYEQAIPTFIQGAGVDAESWQRFLEIQQTSSGKDYTRAVFENVVLEAARSN